ncbi:MAG: Hsp20/alpha crystallin family protein [Chitinivibrionales bacterium]|nr:Hsp20/alpha crystallin family protein [Chitinivibrionales bacterium]
MLWNVDVWSEIERLQREMNALFSNYGRSGPSSTYPLTNIYDSRENIVVTAELPGMTKDDVSITYSDNSLTITGKQEGPANVKKMAVVRQERALGNFEKVLRIPTKIDQGKIGASFTNGILTVTLPKSEEAKPKTITIEAR